MTRWCNRFIGTAALMVLIIHPAVHAVDATSTSFILRDPVFGTAGGYQSSASFQLFSSGEGVSGGENSSAGFVGRFGFEYYPYVQAPVLSTALNATSIDASWTVSAAGLGYSVTGYKIGIASVSGGPYTYTTLGNVTSHAYGPLAPGAYYIIVQTLSGADVLATSNEETETVPTVLTFSLSDNSIGFGTLSTGSSRYATGDTIGATSETEAHQFSASTNGGGGYVITVQGATLAKGASTIAAIGGGNTAPSAGTPQFGLRLMASGGSGSVTAPYAAAGFAYDGASSASQVAASSGDGAVTAYSVRYVANISPTTNNGVYGTDLTYVITATF